MLRTFTKGGVHPEENKLSAKQATKILPPPKIVYITVNQHLGAPAQAVVKPKDKVKVGQLIAKSSGFVSANIHSSVSGTVQKMEVTPDSSGYQKMSIIINVEGDEWNEKIDRSTNLKNDFQFSAEEIVQKINEAGIVGLGGATFPTHVKMSVPKGMKAEVLIINGVECEPFLTSDHRLMLEKGLEIMIGTQIMMKALGVNRAIIGIERNKCDAIQHLTDLCSEFKEIEVCPLKVKYPQGGEKQIIKALIGREVPSSKLPIHVGAVVQNVGTAFAVYEAIQKNKPLIDRIITVTGKTIKEPSNFLVRIGTPVNELILAAGGLPENTGKVISGGPMMGRALNNLEISVSKGTSGILVIPKDESYRKPVNECIRCAKCVSVCPMGLEPYLLMPLAQRSIWDRIESERVMDCIECGSCSFICPSNRQLLDYIRLGKMTVGKIIRSRKS
jgi:electron transport complex protein RnfC